MHLQGFITQECQSQLSSACTKVCEVVQVGNTEVGWWIHYYVNHLYILYVSNALQHICFILKH